MTRGSKYDIPSAPDLQLILTSEKTRAAVAAWYGVAESTISYWCRMRGVKPGWKPGRPRKQR